jgi:Polysaccharide lyase
MSRRITAALAAAAVTLILASGGASGRSTAPGQQLPRNQAPPSISGTAVVPNTLTAGTGTWQGKGLKFAYQWLRCDSAGASCSAISGVTGLAKTLSTADAGSTLRVIVTASNRNGSTAATSPQTAVVAQAASPPPASAPLPSYVPPSDNSLPVVSGTAQQNQTLSTSTGSWSGTTPMTYTYQWQRCDAGGGSCAPILGATAASYGLAAADIGSTLRASVTASNSVGSASASSDRTAVVGALPSSSYYFEDFNGGYDYGFWQQLPGGTNSFITDGANSGALRITDCASSSASSHCSGSQSDYGQEGGIDVVSAPSNDIPHTGRVPGSGSGCCDGNGAGGVDTWYRFHVRFPTGYAPTPGTQNTLWEAHVDTVTEHERAALGYGNAYSTLIGVQGQGTSCAGTPQYCTTPGTQPRLFFQVPGGPTNAPDSQTFKRYYPLPLSSLTLGHWYDVVVHVHWSGSATEGWFQCWLDGTNVLDVHTPTLYTRQNGTLSYAQDVGLFHYRLWANFASSVDYDELVWGPTAASVGFS